MRPSCDRRSRRVLRSVELARCLFEQTGERSDRGQPLRWGEIEEPVQLGEVQLPCLAELTLSLLGRETPERPQVLEAVSQLDDDRAPLRSRPPHSIQVR